MLGPDLDDALMKPFTLRALREALGKWLPAFRPEPPPERLEREVLAELLALDPTRALLRQLVADYLADTPERLQQLREAAGRGSHEEIARLAHGLKSGSVTLGLRPLSGLLHTLEEEAREGQPAGKLSCLISGILAEYERAAASLRALA